MSAETDRLNVRASHRIVDRRGNTALTSDQRVKMEALRAAQQEVRQARAAGRREMLNLRAKFDAAQTVTGNENHWQWADNLDPHAVASETVRRKLRSRSRYEIIENNPFSERHRSHDLQRLRGVRTVADHHGPAGAGKDAGGNRSPLARLDARCPASFKSSGGCAWRNLRTARLS